MKITSLLGLAVTACVLSNLTPSAKADLIAQFSDAAVNNSNYIIPAIDYADDLTVSNFGPAHASLSRRGTGFANYRGWDTSIDLSRYASFTVTADPGHQLELTSFSFTSASSFSSDCTFVWGLRVNNGTGFGDWIFDQTYTSATAGFADSSVLKTWDFADFSTTGAVEFALFASAPDTVTGITAFRGNSTLEGSVSAVPEPSSMILLGLAAIGGAVFYRRSVLNSRRS